MAPMRTGADGSHMHNDTDGRVRGVAWNPAGRLIQLFANNAFERKIAPASECIARERATDMPATDSRREQMRVAASTCEKLLAALIIAAAVTCLIPSVPRGLIPH